jgi:uncharacterized protein (DUF58 family)
VLTWTGRAVAVTAAILLAAGFLIDYPELVALGLACLLAVLVAVAWLLVSPKVEVTRTVSPPRVAEGDKAVGTVRVTNTGRRRSPPVMAVDTVAGRQLRVPLPSVAGGAEVMTTYRLPTNRRGVFAVGPMTVGQSDPLRLMYASREMAPVDQLTVHPRYHRVSPLPTGYARDADGPTSSTAPRGGIAFHAIDEYQPGDDPRLIHWRSTARLGRLMVRHNVTPNESQHLVVLDTSAEPYRDNTFEDAVRVAASLCVAACRAGDQLQFRTTGGAVGRSARGARGRDAVLDLLAGVQVSADDPGLSALVSMMPSQEGVSLGVITGRPEDRQRRAVQTVRGRYPTITLIQIGGRAAPVGARAAGVFTLDVRSSVDFARTWNVAVAS